MFLNWDIFFKWNAFKLTSAVSSYICPGFNVLLWHHAVDTPTIVPRIDVISLTDSMTDVSLIRWQIYSHHHLQHTLKYSHTARSWRFYLYRRPLTHLHCSICTNVPMPMRQLWMIWIYKTNESSRSHKSNQNKTKQNHVRILRAILYNRGIIRTARIIAA